MRQGRLIYLMGASGAGKDSVIDASREGLAKRQIVVVRRIITRSAEASGEQALGVSRETFEQMVGEGAFALHWSANGLRYGIPADIDQALAQGQWVLINGSRGYLPEALGLYPNLMPVMVKVATEVLRARLAARGRETEAEINARLARNDQLNHMPGNWQGQASALYVVDNSTTLAAASEALLELIDHQRLNVTVG
jgi:ribose 1,5-bisphosphokinase